MLKGLGVADKTRKQSKRSLDIGNANIKSTVIRKLGTGGHSVGWRLPYSL